MNTNTGMETLKLLILFQLLKNIRFFKIFFLSIFVLITNNSEIVKIILDKRKNPKICKTSRLKFKY